MQHPTIATMVILAQAPPGTPPYQLELFLLLGGALVLWATAGFLTYRYLTASRPRARVVVDDFPTEIAEANATRSPQAYLLAVEAYSRAPLQINLFPGCRITVGRSSDCDAVIKDIGISRRHALLTSRHGHYFVGDSGSRGGTFVEPGRTDSGVRVERVRLAAREERKLRDGDLVKFYTFVYRYQENEVTELIDEDDTR